MEFENVKVKVEPCEKGQGQGGELSQPYAFELKTEDGEKIVIKQEKDDEETYVSENTQSGSVPDTGTDKPVRVKTEPGSEPKTLLRRALIDLTDDDMPLNPGKLFPFIKKELTSTRSLPVKQKSTSEDPISDLTKVTKMKVEKDLPKACENTTAKVVETNDGEKTSEAPNSSNLVVSQNAANVLFQAAANIGSKNKAEKSNKIKIVFDLSGKLKEWRVEPKSTDSTMPASNLGKILMFANMMKNDKNDGTNKESDTPSLAKLQAQFSANLKAKSTLPPAKKMRMSEEDTLGGEVDGDFEGFKCKICGKEFLHKHAHTAHMKIHHLSLSGLPGSTPKYNDPKACGVIPIKNISESGPTTAATSASSTIVTASAMTSSSTTTTTSSTSSVNTGTSEMVQTPRPVTLVASKTISKLGPAIQPIPGETANKPDSAVAASSDAPTTSKEASSAAASNPNNTYYRCELCHKMYHRYAMFQQHLKSHQREKPFMCGICDSSYHMYSDLESHLLNHSDPNQKTAVHFTCSQCDKEFESEEDLQSHLQSHGHMDTETVYECGMCGKELNSQQELKLHMKKHMEDPFEPCKCGICLSSFSEVEELKKHLAMEHFTHSEFVCDFCKCRFLTSEALKAHMPVHDQLTQSKVKIVHRWKCKYCYRRYESKQDMMDHMQKEHPKSRFYDCSFCETAFCTKEDLQAHMKTHSVVAHFL